MNHPKQIPLTPQTDARNFPIWRANAAPGESGSHFPKMLTRKCTKADLDEWLIKNERTDPGTGKRYFENVAPRIGSEIPLVTTETMVEDGIATTVGEPIIVNDAAAERMFRAHLSDTGLPAIEGPRAPDGEWVSAEPKTKRARKPKAA